jgi:hypothetical protein
VRYRREIRGIAVFRAIPSSLGAVTKEYCDHHTDLTDEIRHVFEAVLMVEHLKLGPYDVSGSFGESVQSIGKRLAQVGDHRILCLFGRGDMWPACAHCSTKAGRRPNRLGRSSRTRA